MDVRTPWMPEDGAPGTPPPAAAETGPDGELRWRVNSRLTALKIAATVLFLFAAVGFGRDPVGLVVGLAAALAVGAFALRDLLVPVRLAADPTGVTVASGYVGRRQLDWAQVERIRVDERRRLGTRSQLLEVDAGESLYLFSGYELSASCADVAEVLKALKAASA